MQLDYDDLSTDRRADLMRYAHGRIDAGKNVENTLLDVERK